MQNKANSKSNKDHAGTTIREERQSDTSDGHEASHGHNVDYDLSQSPGENSYYEEAIFGDGGVFGDIKHTHQENSKNRNNQKQPNKTKGFAHDSKDRVVDGLWEVASGLNGIANTYAKKPAYANGEHGVFYVIGGIGTFPAG